MLSTLPTPGTKSNIDALFKKKQSWKYKSVNLQQLEYWRLSNGVVKIVPGNDEGWVEKTKLETEAQENGFLVSSSIGSVQVPFFLFLHGWSLVGKHIYIYIYTRWFLHRRLPLSGAMSHEAGLALTGFFNLIDCSTCVVNACRGRGSIYSPHAACSADPSSHERRL